MFWRERWRDSGTQMPKPVSDFLTMCEYNPNTTHSTTNIWMFLKQEVILNPRNNKRLLAEFVDALEKLIKRESEEKSERDIFEIKKRKG